MRPCEERATGPLHLLSSLKEPSRLLLPRLFRIAAHNLNLLRRDVVLIVQLEIDILDEERPDLVAKAVGIQMTLFVENPSRLARQILYGKKSSSRRLADLEVHARFNLIGEHFGDGLVKGGDDFHGGLGFDAAGVDEVVESVNE